MIVGGRLAAVAVEARPWRSWLSSVAVAALAWRAVAVAVGQWPWLSGRGRGGRAVAVAVGPWPWRSGRGRGGRAVAVAVGPDDAGRARSRVDRPSAALRWRAARARSRATAACPGELQRQTYMLGLNSFSFAHSARGGARARSTRTPRAQSRKQQGLARI